MKQPKQSLIILFLCIISLTCNAVTIKVGGSTTLTGPTPGSSTGAIYSWSPSYSAYIDMIQTGSPNGKTLKVTGEKAGTVTLTCTVKWQTYNSTTKSYVYETANVKKQTYTVTVTANATDNTPTSVSLNSTSISLQVGETRLLSATVSPSGASQSVTWSVYSGSTYASVSSSGLVTAKAAGTATIRVTSTAKNSVYKDCTVYVSEAVSPTSVSLNYTSLSLLEGGTKQLTANVSPSEASQDVTWSVYSGSSYASVSSSGLVTAKAAGTATIRATSTANSSIYRDCTVTVTAQALTPGTWSGNTLTIGGDATSSVNEVPFGNYYQYSTSQLLYTPTEIGKSGTINSIAFKVANSNLFSTSEVKVYLGHKSGKFSSTSAYVGSSNLTLVYSGSPTLGQTTGWETLTFNQGNFTYNGTDNLVVVVTKKADSYTSSLNYYCYSGSGYTLYRQSDGASDYASVSNTSYPYTVSTNRPSIRFEFVASPTSVSLNYTSISMEVGDSKQLSATVYPSGVSQNVTWSVTSGSGVVSVSSSGIITALAVGTATVRATSASNNSIYKNCTVTVKEKEHNYYYVGSQNDWQIGNKSYPFTKLGDGITWELTMSAADSDDFVIGIDDVDDWTSSDDVLRVASSSGTSTLSGIMTHDNYSSSNFSPNVTGMTSYTIRIVPSTMQYEIVVDCPTYNDGDTFTANTAEGVEMTFKVISAADKTCQVGTGDYDTPPAISKSTTGNITIPKKIKGFNVVSIGEYAFKGCGKPIQIAIPTTISSIGYMGFEDCSSLTNIYIPRSVTSIGDYAFSGCSGLSSIEVDNGNTSFDSRNGCNAIINTSTNTLITGCKNTVIPNSVKSIGGHAFSGCTGLSNIAIPESVTSIGDYAFVGCTNLATVLIPNSVTSLGGGVFRNCTSLTKVTLPETIYGIRFWLFLDCVNLIDIIIPNSVHYIGSGAFQGCNSLTNVTIPNNVSSVEEMAFYGCNSLESITISSSVTSIENEAFANCSQLRSVKSYITEPQNCSIHGYSFYNTSSNATLYVPTGTKSKYETTEGWNQFANIVETGSTTYSEGEAFTANTTEGVEMMFKVISAADKTCQVGDGSNCSINSETTGKLTIPSSVNGYTVTAIATDAFAGTGIGSVVIPSTIESIGENAFANCSKLDYIYCNITDPLECSVGATSFSNLQSDVFLFVPNGTRALYEAAEGWNRFTNIIECYNEKELYFAVCDANSLNAAEDEEYAVLTPNTDVAILIAASGSAISSGNVVIPESIVDGNNTYLVEGIAADVFKGTDITSVTLPSSLRLLGDNVFYGCKHLTEIVIPEGMRAISGEVFSGCVNLKSVTLPSTLTFICRDAFCGTGGSIETITSYIDNPFDIEKKVFDAEGTDFSGPTDYTIYNNATLYVPAGTKAKYEATEGWNIFPNIVEMDIDVDGIYYTISYVRDALDGIEQTIYSSDEEVAVVIRAPRGGEYNGDINIPSSITYDGKTYDVVAIGEGAFADYKGKYVLRSVVIPSSVIAIGDEAFVESTTLESVDIPNSVVCIGENAFGDCELLNNIHLPDNLTKVLKEAFRRCSALTEIEIPAGLESIGQKAFANCNNLTTIISHISEPFDIDINAFGIYDSNRNWIVNPNTTLYIPAGTKALYEAANGWKEFANIVETGSTTYSDGDTFAAMNVDGVTLNYQVISAEEKTVKVIDSKYVDEQPNTSATNAATISIPAEVNGYAVVALENCIFQSWQSLENVILPGTITNLGNGTFHFCQNLRTINIPDGVKEIGGELFSGCTSLLSIVLPSSVEAINSEAFENCSSLRNIVIPDGVKTIGRESFRKCSSLTSITIPNTITVIGKKCFDDSGLESIVIPASLTEIGERAFCDCRSLISLGVEEGNTVYYSNYNSNAIIEKATNKLLYGCKNTVIPESVKIIGARAFQRCSGLESIVIPEGVEQIEEMAFIECKNLKSITLPSTLTYIEMDAFSESPAINQITCSLTQPFDIDTWVFASEKEENGDIVPDLAVYNNATLKVPYGSKIKYETASGWKLFKTIVEKEPQDGDEFLEKNDDGIDMWFRILSSKDKTCEVKDYTVSTDISGSIVIPNKARDFDVVAISTSAFQNCTQITAVEIPTSISSIGSYAFDQCNNLTSVTAGWDEPISISEDCFSNAANAKLYVPIGTNYKYRAASGWKKFGQIANSTKSTITADNVIACRGGQLTLPIILSNDEDIRSLQFEIVLPAGVSVVTNSNGNPVASLTSRANSTHAITGLPLSNGNYQFQIMSKTLSDDIIQGNEGRIATITLKVLLNVIPDDYVIRITDSELDVDGESQSLLLPDTNSKLTVSGILLGDTQDDKRVSVKDISNIIDYILRKEVQDFVWHSANASGDERISVADISTIIDIILRKTVFGEKQATKIEELDPQ